MWTAGGAFAMLAVAWSLAGREVVTLNPAALVIAHRVLSMGRVREYAVQEISNLRVTPQAYDPFDFRSSMRLWGLGGGPIAFDYGAATIRFGGSIEEAEAAVLVRRLVERQPYLTRPAA